MNNEQTPEELAFFNPKNSGIPLKPENEQFTDDQWQSIFDSGDNLLVSASAGSGKTTVLVRRVIEKLKSGTDIDKLLIVTYTEAAAKEMKERIQQALKDAVNKESDERRRQHFNKQMVLLPDANISTLHAFCLTVIRRFYYLIDLDPVFRMLTDETETLLLKEDVWDELREELYAEDNAVFFQLAENFSSDRNDDGLTDLVFSLYEFARANPDPFAWLESLAENYRLEGGVATSPIYQEQIRPLLTEMLQQATAAYAQMADMASGEGLEKVKALVLEEEAALRGLQQAIRDGRLDEAYAVLQSSIFGRYPSIRKEELKETSQLVKGKRDAVKKSIETMKADYFAYSPEEMAEIMEKSAPLVEEMAKIGKLFLSCYAEKKLEKGVLDFNDLEHFTLAILQKEDEEGKRPASEYYRGKFDEVLVDEYQDVNRLQEAILLWLRNPDDSAGNLFMVGDVKQSIYSFRLADPTLFIEKYNAFEHKRGGRRIILAENFRSRSEVLDFTNLVFMQLMDEQAGQIAYDKAAQLITGFPNFPSSDQFKPELLIYEKDAALEDTEWTAGDFAEDKTAGELQMTGLKIRQLVDQKFMIYDKKLKAERPLEYRDIVLLTPTKKNNIAILETFKSFDIPVEVNDAQNYFQASEIRTMVALLQIIDNPLQDIPLAAVLRSPVVGMDERDLAEIRLNSREDSFFDALERFGLDCDEEENEEQPAGRTAGLKQKTARFLSQLGRFREQARRIPIADLLWQIYDETAYPEYVLGLPAGKQRYANLIALTDRAKAYENSSFRGLYPFIRFIEKMQEKDKDLAEPVVISEENAVRVMTIHASKGLEFPVVFVLDMTKRFNLQDVKERYIFEEQKGVGIRFLEPEDRVLKPTLPYQGIRQVRVKKMLSEEMRKLYVALTRAEQKLFLVGSYKDKEEACSAWTKSAGDENLVLPAIERLKTHSSLMNWVGMTLARHPDFEAFGEDISRLPALKTHPASFKIEWKDEAGLAEAVTSLQQASKAGTRAIETALPAGWQEKASALLDFSYPYEEASLTTSYQSVSEIKGLFEDPDSEAGGKLTWESSQEKAVNQHRYTKEELAKPVFMTTAEKPAASAVGTATHTVLQLLDLDHTPAAEDIEALIAELVKAGNLQETIAKEINVASLLDFFASDFGHFLVEHHKLLKREQPFAMLVPAEEVFENFQADGDELLIHGIADGYVRLSDGLVLYDFKTDYIKHPEDSQEVDKTVAKHLGQLRLYRQALEKAEGLPVRKVHLIFLDYGLNVDVTERM